MEYRHCGDSDLELSVLGQGCWPFGGGEYWGEQSQKEVNEVVRRAVELGVTFFDNAEMYNNTRGEQSLGEALKGIPREKVVIGSKISPSNTEPATLIEHCEASLKRLGIDYLDLYMVHWPIHPHSIRFFTDDENIINNPPSAEEAFQTLLKLQEQGKILNIGVSNFGISRLKEALGFGTNIIVNQLPYNLLSRAVEMEILPYCRDNGIGVIGYMTLQQGLLVGIYSTLKKVPPWQKRTRHFHYRSCELCRHGEEGAEEETAQALTDIRAIAGESGLTMSEISIKWALSTDSISCALVGARSVKELEANVKAASEPLSIEIVEKLNVTTERLKEKLGPSLDYWESTANDRTK